MKNFLKKNLIIMIATKTPITPKTAWEVKKAKLKIKFPRLTDIDLYFKEAKRDEMISNVQVKLGKTVKELKSILEAL